MNAEQRSVALRLLERALNDVTEFRWSIEGDSLCSDSSASVFVDQTCTAPLHPNIWHLDIGFAFNRDRADTVVWDCATGIGPDIERGCASAVRRWLCSTEPALRSVFYGAPMGEAGFLGDGGPLGVPGWEAFTGPYLIECTNDAIRERLTRHVLANPPLRAIVPTLPKPFPRGHLVGIKLFYSRVGGQIDCEVRVAGERHEAASRALAEQPWPGHADWGTVRSFTLLIGQTGAG